MIQDSTINQHVHIIFVIISKQIQSSISLFLGDTDNQFGFKTGDSTDQCKFLLKQTSSYFVTMVHLRMLCF